MITPDKHTDVKYSVIYLSGLILKEIQTSGVIKFDELKSAIESKVGIKARDNFTPALSFLFLINRIIYNEKLDAFLLESK